MPLCKKDTSSLQFQSGAIEGDLISFTFPPPNPAEVTEEPDPGSYENETCPYWLRPQSVKLEVRAKHSARVGKSVT